MEPKEQVKTIMDIFYDLKHEDQVSLFQAVKGALLSHRSELIEKHGKDAEFAENNIKLLRDGNEQIHSAITDIKLDRTNF